MCDPVSAVVGVVSAVSAVSNYTQAQKQEKAMKQATQQAKQTSTAQVAQAEKEIQKSEAKKPNIAGMAAANQQAGGMGPASTMLTGPAGVDPSLLGLGRSTLLGA